MNGLLLALAAQAHWWGHHHRKHDRKCSWKGHCLGANCYTENDCSDDLICVNWKCANSTVPAHTETATVVPSETLVATESAVVPSETLVATEAVESGTEMSSETWVPTESWISTEIPTETATETPLQFNGCTWTSTVCYIPSNCN